MKLALLLLCLAAISGNNHASELGRLFFTPQQRQIDTTPPATVTPETREKEPDVTVPPPIEVNINGLIESSSGKRTLWLNQQSHPIEQLPAALQQLRAEHVGETIQINHANLADAP